MIVHWEEIYICLFLTKGGSKEHSAWRQVPGLRQGPAVSFGWVFWLNFSSKTHEHVQ